jgi:hypothetical protein
MSKNIKMRIYITIILSVILYGCETWPPTLWEEHRLRVFKNRVLGRMFGLEWDELIGGWGQLNSEEPPSLSEDDSCSLYQSIGELLTFHAAFSQKPKLFVGL